MILAIINLLTALDIQSNYIDKLDFTTSCLCSLKGLIEQQRLYCRQEAGSLESRLSLAYGSLRGETGIIGLYRYDTTYWPAIPRLGEIRVPGLQSVFHLGIISINRQRNRTSLTDNFLKKISIILFMVEPIILKRLVFIKYLYTVAI